MTLGSNREDGSITLFAVVIVAGLLIALGLVVDGGRQLAAQRQADAVADQAARAGAQALDRTLLRTTGTARLDEAAAAAAARRFLAESGADGAVDVTATTVTVRVTATHPTEVLGLIGLARMTVHATGTATLTPGIATAETR
jgi:Flp pilus assembly protein TadG